MPTVAELTTKELPNWCPACVLPGSLIHTNPSTKKIEEIKVGDRVLGKDGKYHAVTEIMAHRHHGKIYRITAKCFGDTIITGEHPVLVSRRKQKSYNNKNFELEWVKAEELKKSDYLPYPILKEQEDIKDVELPVKKKLMDRKSKDLPQKIILSPGFLRLAGYYLAEGYVHKREIAFTFNKKETEFAEDINNISRTTFGLESKSKTFPNKLEVYINSSVLSETFKEWFGTGAESKKIPKFIMLLPAEKQKELIKGLWRGDGWVEKKGKRASYKTISPILKEQMKQLLLRQKIVPTISINKPYGMHKQSYSVQVVSGRDMEKIAELLDMSIKPRESKSKKPPIIIDDNYAYLPIRKITEKDYDGPVHNLEVADVNSYVSESAILHNCGDFNILFALKNALADLQLPKENILMVSGIGCGSKTPHFLNTYGFEGLHGRGLPVATGAKLANPELTVIAISGDGDTYGIGANHLLHTMRRNLDITLIVQNNAVYGLTKGQYSPTSRKGFKSPSSPGGALEEPINPMAMGIITGATYVARGFAYEIQHLIKLVKGAIAHKGFAIVDVFQPCSTYNKVQTLQWYKENIKKLEDMGHDPTDKAAALTKAVQWEPGNVPIGLFYKEEKPTYDQLAGRAVTKDDISNIDIRSMLAKAK